MLSSFKYSLIKNKHMVSLNQVASVTVSSPWSSYYPSKGQTGRGSVLNPSYPIFVFDYQTPSIAVGAVIGTQAQTLYSQADANYFTVPSIYFTPLGQNYAFGGGGICAQNGCMQNTTDACGPWWFIANLNNNSFNMYCSGLIPNNSYTTHITSVILDLQNQNFLILVNSNGLSDFIVFIIPFSSLSTAFQNQAPSNMKFVFLSPPSSISSAVQYGNHAVIYQGNLVQTYNNGNYVYLDVIPLSTLYSNSQPVSNLSNASPQSLGSAYTVITASTSTNQVRITTIYNGSAEYLLVATIAGSTVYLAMINSSFSTVNTYTYGIQGSFLNFAHVFWNGVLLLPSWSGNTMYLNAYTIQGYEYTSVTGYYAFASAEGYFVVAQQPLNNSTVTFNIYHVLLDHTYVFQNVSITQSGSTVTATGTLYDLTTGSPVANATVYLVAVNSMGDQYSADFTVIASGTTNSSGQFSISGTAPSGAQYFGVYYYSQ